MPGTTSNATPAAAQRQRLLAAAAEDERVAALEPDDRLAAAGRARPAGVDLLLGHRVAARPACRRSGSSAPAAAIATIRGSASRSYTSASHRSQQLAPAQRQQPRVARPGADQVDGHAGRPRCAAAARRPRARRTRRPARCSRRPAPPPAPAPPRAARGGTAWSSAATSCSSPARTCTASAPWPASGTNSCGSNRNAIRSLQPEPDQPGGGQHDRVGLAVVQLAQPGVDVARAAARPRGRAAARAAGRRGAPTTCRRARRPASPPATGNGPQQASRGSARSGTAPITRPSGISPVRSLALCTAASISPSSSARSISRVKTPRPSPIWSNRGAPCRGRRRSTSAPARRRPSSVGHQPCLRQRERRWRVPSRIIRGSVGQTEQLGHRLRVRLRIALGRGLLEPHGRAGAEALPASIG